MLSNTGNVSLILYVIFMLIAFISTIIVYVLLRNGKLEKEKLDSLIDFFKTVVFTTAIGTIALLVTDLFREREQDVKELEYFHQYVEEVKEANGQGRLHLSKYLSIVAPSGEMKDSWTAYYKEVKKEYDDYILAQETLKKADTTKTFTITEEIERQKNREKIELFERPLVSSDTPNEWYIIAGGDANMDAANFELAKAIKINANATIIKKGDSYRTVLVGYITKAEAENELAEVRRSINKTAYIVNKFSWCKNIENGIECLICN